MAPLTAFEFTSSGFRLPRFVASGSSPFSYFISNDYMKDVDGEVLQNLKRLGRKDPTTKVRLLVIFLLQAFVFSLNILYVIFLS